MASRPPKRQPRSGHGESTAGKETEAFPSAAAGQLIDIAHKVYMANEVKRQTEVARKLKPNGGAILGAANMYYTASQKFNDSLDQLNDSYNNLDVYWSGDAFGAFVEFMQQVEGVTSDNGGTLFEFGNALVDLYNEAVAGYNDAVVAIGTTLQQATGIDPDKQGDALIQMLTTFINNIDQRRQTLENNLAMKQGKLAAMSGRVKQLRLPGHFPSSATDKRKWQYEPS